MTAEIVSHELRINAPAMTIFKLMTEAEGLLQWIAIHAEVEANEGGRISWTHENGRTVEGRFLEIEPPNRIVFTYGWRDHETIGPGSTVVEVTLRETEPDSTDLTLVHRLLPDHERDNHADGWLHFLRLLGRVADPRARHGR